MMAERLYPMDLISMAFFLCSRAGREQASAYVRNAFVVISSDTDKRDKQLCCLDARNCREKPFRRASERGHAKTHPPPLERFAGRSQSPSDGASPSTCAQYRTGQKRRQEW